MSRDRITAKPHPRADYTDNVDIIFRNGCRNRPVCQHWAAGSGSHPKPNEWVCVVSVATRHSRGGQ